ncbi:MAG: transposase [Planctomycetota bacterium]
MRNHWDALNIYVSNGQVPIDNNHVEALMQRQTIRNGFQTSGSESIPRQVGYIVRRRAAKLKR